MCFTYASHMHQQNLVLFTCLCIELLELVIKIVFHYEKTSENGCEIRFLSRVRSAAMRKCKPYANWMRPAPTQMIG